MTSRAPSDRAAAAGARAIELQNRRIGLAGGASPDVESTELARDRAEEASARAAVAWLAAVEAHVEAAAAHRRAAAAHERAALLLDDGRVTCQQRAAERHRDAAAVHESTVARLRGEGLRS